MIIAETFEFRLGQYTVSVRPRPDNPGWPVYVVFIGERFVGKSFSRPDEECCRFLERFAGRYAEPSKRKRRRFNSDSCSACGAAFINKDGIGLCLPCRKPRR